MVFHRRRNGRLPLLPFVRQIHGFRWAIAGILALLLPVLTAGRAGAQTTMDALEKALKSTREQHETTAKGLLQQFNQELDRAASSPEAARAFYESVGGVVPGPPDTLFKHLRKDRDKKERDAITDQYQVDTSAALLAYCELMRFAFRSASGAQAVDKNPAWPGWLEKQMRQFGAIQGGFLEGSKMGESAAVRKFSAGSFFRGKKEADWSLGGVPELYRDYVMNALAAQKSPRTVESWDLYIAVMEMRAGNPLRWQNVELPRLLFQKQVALFEMAPNVMALTNMVEILQKHPQHPEFNVMQKKAEDCLQKLKQAPVPATP